MKITCDIIKDLLPLYYDKVCSEDTQKMVEEHLENCESCRKELEYMGNEFSHAVEIKEEKIIRSSSLAIKRLKIINISLGIVLSFLIVLAVLFTKYQYDSHIGTTPEKRQEQLQEATHKSAQITDEYPVDENGSLIICTFDLYHGAQSGIAFFEKQENGSYHFKSSVNLPKGHVISDSFSDYIVFYLDQPDLSYAELIFKPESGENWTEIRETTGLIWVKRPELYSSFGIDLTYYDINGKAY